MHGLVNRSLQCFLRDTYGSDLWCRIAEEAGIDSVGFEALLMYDDAITDHLIDASIKWLGKPRDALLEDLGIYLARLEAPRRLLRFGGVDFVDFLQSLDELPERVHLAVPDLEIPELRLSSIGGGRFTLECKGRMPGFGSVFAGVLRAMADDYGALALIDLAQTASASELIQIELLEMEFASGRHFELALPERGA
ncbi:MAG: heme NO-binding domain-containing protein [Rhodobacteraceae bacterium]|nr:heme NO-binding domain-containing protein [Paracoccaceae bacterium]